jgi:tetratricopeptide (TPR) repeat protein
MGRWIPGLIFVLAAGVQAQQPAAPAPEQDKAKPEDLKKQRPEPKTSGVEAVPPEEDTGIAVTEYSFNPLQAEKELRTGNYYFHKGSYRAAAMRFREATRWSEGLSEAWLRLGEAQEKLKDRKAAHEAYTKYLALAPDARNAAEIRKKLPRLK